MKQFKDQLGSEESMKKFAEQLTKIKEDMEKNKDKYEAAKEEAIKEGKDPEEVVKPADFMPDLGTSSEQLKQLKETMKNLSAKVKEDPKINSTITTFVDKYVFEDKKDDAKAELMKMLSGEDTLKSLDNLENQQCTIC